MKQSDSPEPIQWCPTLAVLIGEKDPRDCHPFRLGTWPMSIPNKTPRRVGHCGVVLIPVDGPFKGPHVRAPTPTQTDSISALRFVAYGPSTAMPT
jgi:hypothetical protein